MIKKQEQKTFRDYGAVDFEDHECEVKEKADEKVNKEIEESLK